MIDGLVYQKFSRTWKPPYQQQCATCGEQFFTTTQNKKYCSYYCTPNKSRPIPKEDGMIHMKVKYTCFICGKSIVETLMVSNKTRGMGSLRCRACAGGSDARL